MNEKVLNLLSLCLQARELGEFVFFMYSPGVNSVNIYAYADYNQVIKATESEECPKKFDYYFYLDSKEEDILKTIVEVEAEILKLILAAQCK